MNDNETFDTQFCDTFSSMAHPILCMLEQFRITAEEATKRLQEIEDPLRKIIVTMLGFGIPGFKTFNGDQRTHLTLIDVLNEIRQNKIEEQLKTPYETKDVQNVTTKNCPFESNDPFAKNFLEETEEDEDEDENNDESYEEEFSNDNDEEEEIDWDCIDDANDTGYVKKLNTLLTFDFPMLVERGSLGDLCKRDEFINEIPFKLTAEPDVDENLGATYRVCEGERVPKDSDLEMTTLRELLSFAICHGEEFKFLFAAVFYAGESGIALYWRRDSGFKICEELARIPRYYLPFTLARNQNIKRR